MHEGLIILSKEQPSKKRVLFSNKPIEKFINAAISVKRHYIAAAAGQSDDHWLLSPRLFQPIQMTNKRNQQAAEEQAKSLDEIITAQVDEPSQKSCIYQVTVTQSSGPHQSLPPLKSKFTQIRVKSIEFMSQHAVAIYFYDITHQVEALEL